MPDYEESNESIPFDDIVEQEPEKKPQIDPGAHILQILNTKYYRNDKNNLIAKLWCKSKTQPTAEPADTYITLMIGREPQITNMALCKQIMGSTGVAFPDKQINAKNIKSIEGETFWAETKWNGDFFNISNPKPVQNEFKNETLAGASFQEIVNTPTPGGTEPETKADADEDFADDIPF